MRPFSVCIDSEMKKTLLTLTLLIVAACGTFFARCVFMPKPASDGTSTQDEAPSLKEWINNSIDEDVPPGYAPHHQWEWIGDAERAQLESVWAVAATNLLNGNVEGMKECVANVSERMRSVSPEQFYGIAKPCYSLLKGDFRGGILSRSHTGPAEFRDHVMADMAGMNVLGEVECSSTLGPKHCAYLEADALAMTRKAIKKFAEEGRDDFVSTAKELEELVIRQIESEDGLTRRYMKADLKMQMLLYERGYSTRENVIRGVRTDAWHLEKTAGYIPKWLDEFK